MTTIGNGFGNPSFSLFGSISTSVTQTGSVSVTSSTGTIDTKTTLVYAATAPGTGTAGQSSGTGTAGTTTTTNGTNKTCTTGTAGSMGSTSSTGSTGRTNSTKTFDEVYAEFDNNVPDRTSTIEEKRLALAYIKRMLLCNDITPEMKNYWSNKKDIIEMEIQGIKNDQQTGKDSRYQDVAAEYRKFVQEHWCENYPQERNEKLEFLDSEEYGLTFYDTCISYLNRILACSDLPDDERAHFEQEMNHLKAEKQSRLGEINWYKQNNNIKTESFREVFTEFDNNVPDRTTTIEEKELAIAYINRMLSCDDITSEMKNYWSNKKDIIEMEIQRIKNAQQTGKDSEYHDVVDEYRNFVQEHWCDNYPRERNAQLDFLDSEEYGLTFYDTCISYLNRILACSDLPDDERAHFEQEMNHINAEKQSRLNEIILYNNRINKIPVGKISGIRDMLVELRSNQ